VVLLLPLLGWLLNMGHRIVLVNAMQQGRAPWPAWHSWGTLLRHGVITWLGMLYYYTPGLALLSWAWPAGQVLPAAVFTGLIALANLAIRAASQNAVSNLDVSLSTLMRESRNAPADEIMTVITMMGDTMVMTALALAILVWLVWHKAYRAAWAAGIAIVAAKLFELAMKLGIQRARPTELSYSGASIFSFPSGHATMAAVIFGILAVLVSHSMGRWGRAVVYAICAVCVVAIGYSRIYLGAHWLSDVLAGLLFGTVMMAAFGVVIEFPVLLVFLQLVGVLRPRQLVEGWRVAIMLIVVLAAVITPSGDPITLALLSVPLAVFYFLAILIGYLATRGRVTPE